MYYKTVELDNNEELVKLNALDIYRLAKEFREYANWTMIMQLGWDMYGDVAYRIELEVESNYNDEGGYYVKIDDLQAFDKEGNQLGYDVVSSFWNEYIEAIEEGYGVYFAFVYPNQSYIDGQFTEAQYDPYTIQQLRKMKHEKLLVYLEGEISNGDDPWWDIDVELELYESTTFVADNPPKLTYNTLYGVRQVI